MRARLVVSRVGCLNSFIGQTIRSLVLWCQLNMRTRYSELYIIKIVVQKRRPGERKSNCLFWTSWMLNETMSTTTRQNASFHLTHQSLIYTGASILY